jgi:hypothetical protein
MRKRDSDPITFILFVGRRRCHSCSNCYKYPKPECSDRSSADAIRPISLVALEFTGNGIMTINRLRTLTEDSLDCLIKQIRRDNQGAGLFIPFASQQHIHAIRFWDNRMHIIGAPFDFNDINELLAEMWSESFICKAYYVAGGHMTDLPASIT